MIKIIGISGVARSGKDTFATCMTHALQRYQYNTTIASLAAPLKDLVNPFIKEHFGIDAWTSIDREKEIIRPLLVAYGGAKRKVSNGRFWTLLMDKKIIELDAQGYDYVIVPDIRYAEYDFDEVHWLKSKGAPLFHIQRELGDGTIVQPPNEDEARNDPRLHKMANFNVRWGNMDMAGCQAHANTYVDVFLEMYENKPK